MLASPKHDTTFLNRLADARDRKKGKKVKHPLIIEMRKYQQAMGLTTTSLVNALLRFEKEYGYDPGDEYVDLEPSLYSVYRQGNIKGESLRQCVRA